MIELLIVATIMALLFVVIAINYSKAKAKSRDSKRIADLHSVEMALRSYAEANDGAMPVNVNASIGRVCRFPYTAAADTNLEWEPGCLEELVLGQYISSLPRDPKYPDSSYAYFDYSYNNPTAAMPFVIIGGNLETYSGTQGMSGSFRWPTAGMWCDSSTSNNTYCLKIEKGKF